MTYQPPPPPPGAGGPPAKFDPKTVNPLDWGIIGAGVLAFLFSFISFYDGGEVTVNGRTQDIPGAYSESFSAWHGIVGGGFFGWFAMVFAVAGAVVVALALFRPNVRLKVPNRLAGLALFAAAAVFEIIAIFVTPGYDIGGIPGGIEVDSSAGHGFGFWASLIVILAGLALSLVRFQSTGGQLPGGLNDKVPNVGGYDKNPGLNGPQQGQVGGYGQQPPPPAGGTPPPPPGYGPPQ